MILKRRKKRSLTLSALVHTANPAELESSNGGAIGCVSSLELVEVYVCSIGKSEKPNNYIKEKQNSVKNSNTSYTRPF